MEERDRCKIMILCWGFSIHARRRAQLFIDDPRFDVTVVSTYDYGLEGADNVLLSAAGRAAPKGPAAASGPTLRQWIVARIPLGLRPVLKAILTVLKLPVELAGMWRDWQVLRQAHRRVQPDILLLQTLQYPSFLAYLLPARLPMAVTFWNGDLTYFAKWTGVEMFVKKQIVTYGLRRANALTVNSQTALDAGVALGAERTKFTLVRYPGADLSLFQPKDRSIARQRLSVSAQHVVLCPRGLGDFFNSDIIIQAAAEVAKTHPDVLFLFISGVGGKDEWDRHVEMARSLAIEDRIRWDGDIRWEEMPWYYAAADLILSIKTADSCPNCMLEAMACAIPVVMSDTSQNREWIEDGGNGYLCAPRDVGDVSRAVASILDSKDLAQRFADISLAKVQRDADSKVNVVRIKDLVLATAFPDEAP